MNEKLPLGPAGKSRPKSALAKRTTAPAKQQAAPASNAPPKSPSDLIHKMRTGEIAKVAIKRVASTLDISQDRLFTGLRLPKSTMHSRMASGKRLSPLQQDRLYRAERVIERATVVIEDLCQAQRWIQNSIHSLGGATPLSP